jgi:hypothetical protein
VNTGGRAACALMTAAVVIGLSGCGVTVTPRTAASATAVGTPIFEDYGLRDVRMTSGRALGYVQPETASQILCQLLDKGEWEDLLGGSIGRRPLVGANGGCTVTTADGGVMLELRSSDDALEPDTTIAGRPARTNPSQSVDAFTVALTDEALEPAPRQYFPERRLLSASVLGQDTEEQRDLVADVLEKVVPLVVAEGEELPDIDDRGRVRFVDTPLTGDFVDLPIPVQALQLCTIMREEPGVREVEIRDVGDCRVQTAGDTFTIATRDLGPRDNFPDRVAGRPALISDGWLTVRLLDEAAVGLWVSSDDPQGLAEKLVPLLTA